ncbi:MAG: hypothetical protein R6U98_01880 [Pirellulaceae bacterium]
MVQKFQRRSFIKASSAVALGLGACRGVLSASADRSKAEGQGKLPYRVIYNQDDTNLFYRLEEPIEPEHVDGMVDEVADAGADLFLACCNNQRVNYPSQVWETMWDEYRERGTVFGGKRESLLKMVRQEMRLADMGCDYLERVVRRCAERGIASGISVRMDDFHWRGPDSVGKNTIDKRLGRFYQNREIYLPESEWDRHGGRWAYDFEHPDVREHYLALIRELVERYEMDVLDLDFLRHPVFFDRRDLAKHCETMTGFMREVNKACAGSGKSILISARVPSTPANCRGLGLDVAAWSNEGLVNGIALGMKNCTGWQAPVDAFRSLVGPNVSIYGATERQAGRTASANLGGEVDQKKSSAKSWSREMFRGFAAGYLACGADGIYLFNFFVGNRDLKDVLAEMHALESLRGKQKAYRLTSYGRTHAVEADLPMQVPMSVPAQQARRFEMFLAAEPTSVQAEAVVLLDRALAADDVWLQLNDTPLGHAIRISAEPLEERYYSWWNILDVAAAVFSVPASAIKDGRNQLVVRNEGESVSVLGLAIRTR